MFVDFQKRLLIRFLKLVAIEFVKFCPTYELDKGAFCARKSQQLFNRCLFTQCLQLLNKLCLHNIIFAKILIIITIMFPYDLTNHDFWEPQKRLYSKVNVSGVAKCIRFKKQFNTVVHKVPSSRDGGVRTQHFCYMWLLTTQR